MKRLRNLIFPFLLITGGFAYAQPAAVSERISTLTRQIEVLTVRHNLDRIELQKNYRAALESVLEASNRRGQLDLSEEITAELQRIRTQLTPPESYSLHDDLNRLQTTLRYSLEDLNRKLHLEIQSTYTQADTDLESIQKDHVRANEIDTAIQIKATRDELEQTPKIREAVSWLDAHPVKENRPPLTSTWTFLSDTPHKSFSVGYGTLGKGDQLGYGRNIPVKVNNAVVTHGLSMHPPTNGKSFVEFELNPKAQEFKAQVGINHTGINVIKTPLLFRVIGDGKVLWTSNPLGAKSTPQAVEIPLPDVSILRLEVECRGPYSSAHAIWVAPQVR